MVKPRTPKTTVKFIDTYCELYRELFTDVRAYENFKYFHIGLISEVKRKSLPALAKAVGLENEQGLLHFLTESPWLAEDLEKKRLEIILRVLEGREIVVIIDETGDKKKGKKTDYVKRQYIGNLGKIESGIVSVNAYGYYQGITFPLKFKVFKPKGTLKEGDKEISKPELGAEIVKELKEMGFHIKRVLADSLYGESGSNFIRCLEKLEIEYAVAIRSNHGVWLPEDQTVTVDKWQEFKHISWDGKSESRYIREIVYGHKTRKTYWQITRDKLSTETKDSWYVMTNIEDIKYKDIGGIYGDRPWIEYGFRQSKSELGWADFRVTSYEQIRKWWELVMSAYLMISLHCEAWNPSLNPIPQKYQDTESWNERNGWKNWLNNLRLLLQPFILFNLLKDWLKVFPIPQLSLGFTRLIAKMNQVDCLSYFVHLWDDFYVSTA